MEPNTDPNPARRLITRLREFAAGLPEDERRLFLVLLAPGVVRVYDLADYADSEVTGFEHDVDLSLSTALAAALREFDVEVHGL